MDLENLNNGSLVIEVIFVSCLARWSKFLHLTR